MRHSGERAISVALRLGEQNGGHGETEVEGAVMRRMATYGVFHILPNSKVGVPTSSDLGMGAVDWLLMGYSPLLGVEMAEQGLSGVLACLSQASVWSWCAWRCCACIQSSSAFGNSEQGLLFQSAHRNWRLGVCRRMGSIVYAYTWASLEKNGAVINTVRAILICFGIRAIAACRALYKAQNMDKGRDT